MTTTKPKARKIYPVPEALDGAKWDVRASQSAAMTDTKRRQMHVPATDTPQAQFLRAHETAHARITPKVHAHRVTRKYKVSMEAMQACEDMRVNQFLRGCGIECAGAIADPMMTDLLVRQLAEEPRKLGALLCSTRGTNDYEAVVDAMERLTTDDVRDHVFDAVEYVHRAMRRAADDATHGKGFYGRSRKPGRTPFNCAKGLRDVTIPAARLFDLLLPENGELAPGDAALTATYATNYERVKSQWGVLQPIRKIAMTKGRRPKGGGGKSWRDEGACPIAPYRLTIDGRIFCRRKRLKGGTVLVDASGSMSLSHEDLEQIVKAAPGATVAMYSGMHDDGRLTIVAERGRMASADDIARARYGGSNVVDGPALRWLASKPGPRVWVSDGFVTGVGDRCALHLLEESLAICRQGSIKRVERSAAVLEALK